MMIKVGQKLALWASKAKAPLKEALAKMLTLTTGRVEPEAYLRLIEKGADKILIPKNLGSSIDLGVVDKAVTGLDFMRRKAQDSFGAVVRPLIRNDNLVTGVGGIHQEFRLTLIDRGFIDEAGKILTGAFPEVSTKEGTILLKRLAQIEKMGNKGVASFGTLLKTRQEIDVLIKGSKGLVLKPRSSNFNASLLSLRSSIRTRLHDLGGETFTLADGAFADKMDLFDNLFKVLKTPQTAENTLERVIKASKQSQFINFNELDDLLPSNMKFLGDLEDFALAQQFKSQTFNLIRAGIIGNILGFSAASIGGGPVGVAAGLGSAFFATTPKGTASTVQFLQNLSRGVASRSPEIGKAIQKSIPLLSRNVGEARFPQGSSQQ